MGNNNLRMSFRVALFATVLAFIVVVLGAYTRLTDAGLGCPDWPRCYGHWIVSSSTNEANPLLHTTKAWTEMIHRYFAGLLGLMVVVLALLAIRNRRFSNQPVLLPITLGFLILFQALLGMWTVTLKLFPLVVIAHLLGGLTTLSLLWWLTLTLKGTSNNSSRPHIQKIKSLRLLGAIALLVLIIQLFLGGWTSANYAALVCLDFPFCNKDHSFILNILEAFNITSAGVTGSIGKPLSNDARITIHMLHRIGALLTTLVIGWLALLAFLKSSNQKIQKLSIIIIGILIIQVSLGIANILALLPLLVATTHNAMAALLLLALVTFNYYLYLKEEEV